jgi:hypothetical protein
VSEDHPPPSLLLRCLGVTVYVGLLTAAGALAPFLALTPLPRRAELSAAAEWFYGFWVWVAEFEVALLVHLRWDRRSVEAARCPRCGGKIDVRFDETGGRLLLRCPGWHVWSSVPLMTSPPWWWRERIERPCWEDDAELVERGQGGRMGG